MNCTSMHLSPDNDDPIHDRYVKVRPNRHQGSPFDEVMGQILRGIWDIYVSKPSTPPASSSASQLTSQPPDALLTMFNAKYTSQSSNQFFTMDKEIISMIASCAGLQELKRIDIKMPNNNIPPVVAIHMALQGEHGYSISFLNDKGNEISAESVSRAKTVVVPKLCEMLRYGIEFAHTCTDEGEESRLSLGLRKSALSINRLLWAMVIASCSTTVALLTFASILTSPMQVLDTFTPLTEDSLYAFIDTLKNAAYHGPMDLALASCGLISTFILLGSGLSYLARASDNVINQHMNPGFAAYIKFETAFCSLKEPLVAYANQSMNANSKSVS
ncbi:MAG: hypothetical protein JSS50_05395 [Proteobacteria bacterium]|nr:hypothetical protein [Pseudomonadota bacterium]